MMSPKSKYILYLTLLNGLLVTLLICWWRAIFEDARSMAGITFALVMFFLYELFVILYTDKKSKTINSRQSINLFLGIKAGKVVLSLLFIAIYAMMVKIELTRFILIFLVLYFIFLFFDTMYLVSREKDNKKKYKLKEVEKLSNYYKQ